jgi:hypothetical protein
MPEPIAICIEDLQAQGAQPRFIRCVAISGALPGLGIRRDGQIAWEDPELLAFELWVSQDERLILRRPVGAIPVRVHRAGRFVDAPFGKPVVLIDQDQVTFGTKHCRIHVHGLAQAVHAPSPIIEERSSRSGAKIAAALAMGAAALGCQKIDVLSHPPEPLPAKSASTLVVDSGDAVDAGAEDAPEGLQEASSDARGNGTTADEVSDASIGADAGIRKDGGVRAVPTIDVRNHPPKPVMRK